MNLFERLEHAGPSTGAAALLLDGRAVSYGAFFGRVRDLSNRLTLAGIGRGQCVGIAVRNPVGYLATVLALVRLGAIASEFQAGWPPSMQHAIVRRHRLAAIVADDAVGPFAVDDSVARLSAQSLFSDRPLGLETVAAVLDAGELPWIYALSSGTTGMPKTVVRSQAALLSLLQLRSPGPPPGSRVMLLNPVSMMWMLHVAIEVLLGRGTVLLSSNAHADDLLRRIELDSPTHLVASTDTASKLAWYRQRHADRYPGPCRGLVELQLSGSRPSDAARALISEVFPCRRTVILGASEIGPIAGRTDFDPDRDIGLSHEHDGRLYPGVEAHAVDEAGQRLPHGVVGRLRMRSPGMTMGYLDDDGALVPFADGWFVSDDRGAVDAEGYVRLEGRVSDVLNLAGRKVDPLAVERELERHPDIAEAAVVAARVRGSPFEVLAALIVSERDVGVAEVRATLRDRLPTENIPEFIARVEALPRNAMGKLMRDRLAGSLEVDPT